MSSFDHPLQEVADSAQNVIESGGTVFQKFTCGGCGKRLTMDVPNTFFTEGTCDNCDHVTDIEAQGCNFLVTLGIGA